MEPPDTRVLLPTPADTPDSLLPREAVSSPLPNLTPRHQELIPTPCGPIKPWAELSSPVKIYFCITIISLLSIIGLTIENLVQQKDEDFPVSLIQLIGVVFCIYYLSRGILQENRQELSVFILSIALVMLRSVVNFTVLPARQKPKLLARFVLILMVGAFDVICAAILMQSDSRMAFRVGGALESLQAQYFMLNLCFSMLTFDLQAQPGDLRLTQPRLGRRDYLGRLEGHLRHPCDLERIKASRLDFSGPEFTGSGLSRLLALQGRNRVGPREFVRPGSCHHHLLLHFRGDQECPLWGVIPRLPELWTRTERKDVFFLWKDRFMKGSATPPLAAMLL